MAAQGHSGPESPPDGSAGGHVWPAAFGSTLARMWQPLERFMLPCLALKFKASLRACCTTTKDLVDAKAELFWRPLALAVAAQGIVDASASSHELQHFLKQQLNMKLQAGSAKVLRLLPVIQDSHMPCSWSSSSLNCPARFLLTKPREAVWETLISEVPDDQDPALCIDSLCSHQVLDTSTWQPVRFTTDSPESDMPASLKIQPHTRMQGEAEVLVTSITAEWLPASDLLMVCEEFLDATAESFQGVSIRVLDPAEGSTVHGPQEFMAFRDRMSLSEEQLTSTCKTRRLVAKATGEVLVLALPSLNVLLTLQSPFSQDAPNGDISRDVGPRGAWHHAVWISFMAGDHVAVAWRLSNTSEQRQPHNIKMYNAVGHCVGNAGELVEDTVRYTAPKNRLIVTYTHANGTYIKYFGHHYSFLFDFPHASICWSADGHFMHVRGRSRGACGSSAAYHQLPQAGAIVEISSFPVYNIQHAGVGKEGEQVVWSAHGSYIYCADSHKVGEPRTGAIWSLEYTSSISLFTSARMLLINVFKAAHASALTHCAPQPQAGCYLEHCSEQQRLGTQEPTRICLPSLIVGHFDSVLDAKSVAWNPGLACPTIYAISDDMGGLHLVNASKHTMHGSWTAQELFGTHASNIRGSPATGSSTQHDVSSMGAPGPLSLLWSANGHQLICHGCVGTALVGFDPGS
ncbi:hypothetical protein WJX74_000136 [Apatococcus lobatus]|uniref:Uncharacterized protein n=1 Tax=Apatococcus lobatus TaxID=904363 RepID=A0AAW1Q8T9_9CHLO